MQCNKLLFIYKGGSGYVEDGREIFDDDLDEESIQEARKRHNMAGPRKKKKQDTKKKGDIQSMFRNMPSKKDTTSKDDNILEELLNEFSIKKKMVNSPKPDSNRNKFCRTVHSHNT